MDDIYDLQRFLEAQAGVYEQVRTELKRGRKTSHWIWFVFPQIRGLGSSPMAVRYAIASLDEARTYLAHPVLGERMRECCELLVKLKAEGITEIMGFPDDLKLKSSMTLFSRATEDKDVFLHVLKKYFEGELDQETLRVLGE